MRGSSWVRFSWPAAFLVFLAAGLRTSPVFAGPASSPPPPAPAPLLGHGHLLVSWGRIDLDDAAAREWGVDREGYFAFAGYRSVDPRRRVYFGGEFAHAGSGGGTRSGGETIRDFDLYWIEANGKRAFALGHGWSADVGLGTALFYVDGTEVTVQAGEEFGDPLADVGYGAHVFADTTWRVRRLLLGVDARYQWAFDLIDVDYSNVRVGVHLGVAF